MANTAQARKRATQANKRRENNVAKKSRMRTFIKRVVSTIADGDKANASAAYTSAVPIIDGAASKGLIHKNKAARYKSRLNSQIRAMS